MPRRPTSVTVIGVLQLIFGFVGGACGICGGVIAFRGGFQMPSKDAGQKATEQQQWIDKFQQANEALPGGKSVGYAFDVLLVVLIILMIASGIGLLNFKRWGRTACLLWACLTILWGVLTIAYAWAVQIPANNQFFANNPHPGGQAMTSAMQLGNMLGGTLPVVPIIYALIVLGVMLSSSVALAFAGGAPLGEGELPRTEEPPGPDEGWSDSANP
jgi:hypothetical protein